MTDKLFHHTSTAYFHSTFKWWSLAIKRIRRFLKYIEHIMQYFGVTWIDSTMNNRDMIKYRVDISTHTLLYKILDKFHIVVSYCIHKWVPIVRSVKLVDKMWEGIEEIDSFFSVTRFYVSRWYISNKIFWWCRHVWLRDDNRLSIIRGLSRQGGFYVHLTIGS